ncbi:DUF4998 domain-containing protein [Niabella drilacis]|uniref:Uncharacterized protein n=1 Tax=Niabella drilacis (strain DSM 25811 / CCM 8410 / CCUG 62505 / LMG 26954 / E90) TaxID=1285928 RepID=A0A1G6X3K9_NIADE|nr:DUF4998 domain-containing protein [Niabella drilacis]SDD72698.1 protein of unknown function [Niabella drilacis]
MKKITYLICPFLFAAGLCISSCTKEDDYKKFTKDGEISYPGKASNIIAQTGNKRVRLRVVLGPDPSITKIKTYWNSRADSLETAVVRNDGDTVNVIIDKNLNEGSNNFEVYTYNSKGDQSVVSNVSGNVYGDNYLSTVPRANRSVSSVQLSAYQRATINWGAALTDERFIEIYYTDAAGAAQTLRVPSQSVTNIPSYQLGTAITYRSLYAPENNAYDLFSVAPGTVDLAKATYSAVTTGYLYHPSSPRALSATKTLIPGGANGLIIDVADLGGSGYKALITVNPDNSLTVTEAPGAAGAPYMMFTAGLPAPYTAAWTGSASCNNTYDPVTKTYKVRYGYGTEGAYRVTEEIIVMN